MTTTTAPRPNPGHSRARPRIGPSGAVSTWLKVIASLGAAFLTLPLLMLLLRAPWGSMGQALSSTTAKQALALSAFSATAATICALFLGLPLAFVLAKSHSRKSWLLRAIVLVPLVLPPVVGGTALLLAFGRTSILGGLAYRAFGVQLPFTTAGVVVAETFVALPFIVLTLEAAIRSHGDRLDQAAATLGASRWQTIRFVTIPILGPAIVAGAMLGFARALGEFGATITFAGSFPGTTQTLPLAIYQALETQPDTAAALSVVLLGFTALALVLLRGRLSGWGRGADA